MTPSVRRSVVARLLWVLSFLLAPSSNLSRREFQKWATPSAPPFPLFFFSWRGGEFFLGSLETNKNKDPQFIMGVPISPGQKWWWTVLEIEISCSQWEGSACTQSALIFFSFKFWGGGRRTFSFSFVPNMFPWGYHKFPMCSVGSQCVRQGRSQ